MNTLSGQRRDNKVSKLFQVSLPAIGGSGVAIVLGGYLAQKYYQHQAAKSAESLLQQSRVALQETAKLLESDAAATRITAVVTLAEIADTYQKDCRQQVVDILCGYLRTPRDNDGSVESVILQTLAKHLRKKIYPAMKITPQQAAEEALLWCDCDIDLHGATFTQSVDFTDAVFVGNTDFCGATFQQDVSFRRARFSQATTFEKAVFKQIAGFSSAVFTGNANFWKVTIGGVGDFLEATFSGEADFWKATFSEPADFSQVTFLGDTDFEGATFGQDANFSEARFGGNIDFSQLTFSKTLSFSQATFAKEARCMGVECSADHKNQLSFPAGFELENDLPPGATWSAGD